MKQTEAVRILSLLAARQPRPMVEEATIEGIHMLVILGDKVETVAPWLVTQILNNDASGNKIEWLTRPKIFARFLTAPFNKRDLFAD